MKEAEGEKGSDYRALIPAIIRIVVFFYVLLGNKTMLVLLLFLFFSEFLPVVC